MFYGPVSRLLEKEGERTLFLAAHGWAFSLGLEETRPTADKGTLLITKKMVS